MIFTALHHHGLQPTAGGFTLVELLTSAGLGVVMLGFVAILFINGSLSFQAVGNYQNLDAQSTTTLDTCSREIRNATAVVAYVNGKSLVLTNATQGTSTVLTYDSTARTLVTTKTGEPARTNLTGCDAWSFSLFGKAPNISTQDISFISTTNPASCKLISMTWKCSRTILGSKLTTESEQAAEVVLRNKVY